ncbi:MAG TPA: DUF3299 domain-containing protein [Candidatus Binatia bacterium]|jgi:hypothetical protein|nr:DUF3299 domain-containing protein [Candidatus Binatia bacterium]
MKRPKIQKAKAQAAANRRAYLWFGIGIAVGLVIVVPPLLMAPAGSARQMVWAQAVRGKPAHPKPQTNSSWGALSPAGTQPTTGLASGNNVYLTIGFDRLAAFPFVVTAQMVSAPKGAAVASRSTLEQVPEEIKALDQRRVSLKGFMLPLKFEGALATDFLLMRNQSLCCFGVPPKITEWVNVHLAGKGAKPIIDEPVTICGTFHVGDVRENGDLVGIYRLDAEKCLGTAP